MPAHVVPIYVATTWETQLFDLPDPHGDLSPAGALYTDQTELDAVVAYAASCGVDLAFSATPFPAIGEVDYPGSVLLTDRNQLLSATEQFQVLANLGLNVLFVVWNGTSWGTRPPFSGIIWFLGGTTPPPQTSGDYWIH